MYKNIIRDSINCLGEAQLEDTTYEVARDITLCYLQELEEEYKELEEKNKILEENAIHNDKVVDEAKWNENLYKSRIDKAIEYIEEKYDYILGNDTFLNHDERIDRKQIKYILEILKGEE